MTDETQTTQPDVNPDDSNADADLARQARAQQFRMLHRMQLTMVVPALLLVALGLIFLLAPSELTAPLRWALAWGALGIGLLARFLLNGRRERGLVFVAALILVSIAGGALVLYQNLDMAQVWPLGLVAAGLALILTFLLERGHERGVVVPGLLLIAAGGVALLFTAQVIKPEVLRAAAAYWPAVFILLALILLPRVFRGNAR